MNYDELKPIFDEKTFDILANLTDNPTVDLYLPDYTTIDNNITFDPFENSIIDMTNITSGNPIFIKTVRCVYTYDKFILQEQDANLGGKYSLIVYLRTDDLPPVIKENPNVTLIKFDNKMYETETVLNLYNILHEFHLK
jgi:hypothetical protein